MTSAEMTIAVGETEAPKPSPFPVWCGDCGHEWSPEIFLPMEITKAARVIQGLANCPRCGCAGDRVFCGKKKPDQQIPVPPRTKRKGKV